MKELTIEQKAKRYDEVINRMKRYVVDEYGCSRIKVADVFPELKESEDERVRNALIEHCRKQAEMYNTLLTAKEYSEVQSWIAWLEKQRSVEEIVERCKTSWFNAGKTQGKMEGLSDEEKYLQGWHDALEKQSEQKHVCSENDERIRKGLMTAVSGTFDGNTLWHTDVTKEEALDWLEKIGEHIRFWLCKAVQARDRVAKPRKGFTSIPFGTDSEFIKEAIAIPDGCVATIEGNKIHIKKK